MPMIVAVGVMNNREDLSYCLLLLALGVDGELLLLLGES